MKREVEELDAQENAGEAKKAAAKAYMAFVDQEAKRLFQEANLKKGTRKTPRLTADSVLQEDKAL